MRFAVFARCVSVFAVLLCWPVIALAASVKPRRVRRDAWTVAYDAWLDHEIAGHRVRAHLWGAVTDRIAS